MQRRDSTADFWFECAKTYLTTTDFSPPEALAAAKLALTHYQRTPTAYPDFNLAKTYAAIAEGFYLSKLKDGITNAILFFMLAEQSASVDDINSILDQFRNFLSQYEKNTIFEAIKKVECKNSERFLLRRCQEKHTCLGTRMYASRFGTPCSLQKGTLKDICDRLVNISDDNILISKLPPPNMSTDAMKWLRDALFFLRDTTHDQNYKAALIYAKGAFQLYTPTDTNKIELILIYYFRGLIFEKNEDLTAAINDMNKSLELLALLSAQEVEQCHLRFKSLSDQNSIETIATHFSNRLINHFPAHIFDAIKKNDSPDTIARLIQICLDRNSVMGSTLLKMNNGPVVLQLMRKYINEEVTYDANSNLFSQKKKDGIAVQPINRVNNGVTNGH